MNTILKFEKTLSGKSRKLFRLIFWTIIHTISIIIATTTVLYLNISNLWVALAVFGAVISLVAGIVNKYIYDHYFNIDRTFLYFIIVHASAIFIMNTLFVPLSGVTNVIFKFLISGFGVAFIARLAKKDLMKKIILGFFVLLVLGSIPLSSDLGQIADLGTFLLSTYIIAMATWLILKYINSLDLHSDLTIWGIRLAGVLVSLFGFLMLGSTYIVTALMVISNRPIGLSGNLPWVFSAGIMLIGAFMIFRSKRRYTIIGFW